ncbi:unnamed protein product [Auanema sp. JU1783]|nr:unnamed protein product [Auanema sp. JU1783]
MIIVAPSPRSAQKDIIPHTKYILVTGGVISGVGKGIISSSLGVLLKNNGYRVSAIKIDPYINIDAGTFSPYEHGEVFVLDDGGEVDLDLGNYERFLNIRLNRDNNITTGKLFQHVIQKERKGDYMGKTVQMIPHITDAIVDWVERVAAIPVDGSNVTPDVCIIELGGTIGDIEGMAYLAAFERFQTPSLRDRLMNVHVSLILHPNSTGELKTKPMQNSVRQLRAAGLGPDLLICRSTNPLDEHLRVKIADFGLVSMEQVIGVHDVSNIYKVPLLLQEQGVLDAIVDRLHLAPVEESITRGLKFNMCHWTHLSALVDSFQEVVNIALVGKYTKFADAYASVNKSLSHAAIHSKRKLKILFVDSEQLENPNPDATEKTREAWNGLRSAHGIIVPGGFDKRGVEGMINCCKYARENNIPFLGVCLGMQCAAIEYTRNVLNVPDANSTEFCSTLKEHEQVIIDMPEHDIDSVGLGATMRLGRRPSVFITHNSKLRKLYGQDIVEERHRHRYEVNPKLVPDLCQAGLMFVAMGADKPSAALKSNGNLTAKSPGMFDDENELLCKISDLCNRGGDGVTGPAVRMEMLELKDHPYYVGVQFHPEYLSQPLIPSPPFLGLLLAATNQLEGYLSGSKTPTPMITLHPQEK